MEKKADNTIKKKDLLLEAQKAVETLLKKHLPINFIKSELYLIDKRSYGELLKIDSILMPHRKDTKKTNIYSINTFVNVLNPKYVAFSYTLTPVKKRKQLMDFAKIQPTLGRELSVSKNMLNDDFVSLIENNDLSELMFEEKQKELDANIKKEQEYFDYIQNNPEEFKKNDKLKVLTAPVLHGQIRFYYFDEKKVKQNKQMHLSSEKPNILVFDESGGSKKRKDNKIDDFLNNSIRVFGNVYMKKD